MNSVNEEKLARNNPYMKMFVYIMRTGQFLDQQVSAILKQFDITHVQFNVLRNLEVAYPRFLSTGDIKKELIFPASDVSRLLDRLVKRNLIERRICPGNRRKIDISITTTGLNLISEILPVFENRFNGYYKNIILEHERDLITETLKKIH